MEGPSKQFGETLVLSGAL